MSYLVSLPLAAIRGHPLTERICIRVPLKHLQSSFGTASSVMKAAWALVLSHALDTQDVVFGGLSVNRYLTLLGIDQMRGPCLNFVPVRACLDPKMTLASLITQMQDQTVTSLPYHHLGSRSIIKDCTTWPCWTRFSSVLVYQNHKSLDTSLRIGNVDCALSSEGKVGDSADIWAVATPLSEDLEIMLWFSSHTIPSEQIRWDSRSLIMILEEISTSSQQIVSQVGDSLRTSLGTYIVPPSLPAPLSDLVDEHMSTHQRKLKRQSRKLGKSSSYCQEIKANIAPCFFAGWTLLPLYY
jgi:hypothetical protein